MLGAGVAVILPTIGCEIRRIADNPHLRRIADVALPSVPLTPITRRRHLPKAERLKASRRHADDTARQPCNLCREGAPGVRVLVVDDSAFMRRMISQFIANDPSLEVIDTAKNGQEAVDKAKLLRPDVVTLDIEMPIMDGLEALRQIRLHCSEPKPAVIMCSSLTSAGSHEALKAMRLGAADVVAKDASIATTGLDELKADLIAKIKAVGASRPATAAAAKVAAPAKAISLADRKIEIILIGSSTGGPPVLETILTRLPADLPVPVVVAQHMPALFTKSLAERLDQHCAVTVIQADGPMPLSAGMVAIIQGGKHGRVTRGEDGRFRLDVGLEPKAALYKPSVDELLRSGVCAGERALGVVLTGMGEDGAIGGNELHRAGGTLIAQEGSTCVVYGMPRAIVSRNLAHAALSPDDIATTLASLAPSSRGRLNTANFRKSA